MIRVKNLSYAGVMANYRCTAACRHCLYSSSPSREAGYITKEMSENVAKTLYENGCRTVHIGGGEPFLDFEALIVLVKALAKYKVSVDYIETNAFWAKDESKVKEHLHRLLSAGVDTLCISLDPFHAEYVPTALPLKLTKMCDKYGMGSFLWKGSFIAPLSKLDINKKHSREEFEAVLGDDYIESIANYYGVKFGGRAINIEEEFGEKIPFEKCLNSSPCRSIVSTSHFHVDMFGNFIPPSCTGIAIPLDEIVNGTQSKYLAAEALLSGGVQRLFDLAQEKGFTPAKEYSSSCVMCFYIRKFLSESCDFPELPKEHYKASLSYYST